MRWCKRMKNCAWCPVCKCFWNPLLHKSVFESFRCPKCNSRLIFKKVLAWDFVKLVVVGLMERIWELVSGIIRLIGIVRRMKMLKIKTKNKRRKRIIRYKNIYKQMRRKVIFCNREFIDETYRTRKTERKNLKNGSSTKGFG